MTQIRAFVGHSFAVDDEVVIRTFLAYFNQMKGALPDFDWVHAKAAQPTELAAKVLKLIEGRNVFIGICTKRERVTVDEKLRPSWFDTSKRTISDADLEWKTSDWIIQEIGLAIGRDMTIVLLVENGCRRPGGLQGDVEFIPFDRPAPERAFGQLLEMMMALSPRLGPGEAASSDFASEATGDEAEAPPVQEEDAPDGTWDYQRFENAFFWRIISNNEEGAAAIEKAYLETDEASDVEKQAEWRSMCDSWRIMTGHGGNLEKLKQLRQASPNNPKIIKNLAEALASLGVHAESATEFEAAAEKLTTDRVESERLRGKAAIQIAKDGQTIPAFRKLKRQRQRIADHPDEELSILYAMKEIAEITKDIQVELQVLERISELRPDDWDNKFNLAYKYSNNGYGDLALHHYIQIPLNERTPITWNNLGVAFQSFAMPSKSVIAYRKSAAAGETLAMSNLAYKFMEVGLVDEAKAMLNTAISAKDFHRNVGVAMSALQDIFEEEEKKLEKMLVETKPKADFFKGLGRAMAAPDFSLETAIWQGPNCPLEIVISNEVFNATGYYSKKQSALGLMISGQDTVDQYMVKYAGKIVGRRIIGTVERKRVGDKAQTGLLSLMGEDTTEFMMMINATSDKISAVEKPTSNTPQFYEIVRSPGPDGEIKSATT